MAFSAGSQGAHACNRERIERERGGGKEREIRLTFVHSGGREGRKDDRKGDGVADSAQKVSEVLDRLGLSNPPPDRKGKKMHHVGLQQDAGWLA